MEEHCVNVEDVHDVINGEFSDHGGTMLHLVPGRSCFVVLFLLGTSIEPECSVLNEDIA